MLFRCRRGGLAEERREALEEPIAGGAAEQHGEREPHAVRHNDEHEPVRPAELHELQQREGGSAQLTSNIDDKQCFGYWFFEGISPLVLPVRRVRRPAPAATAATAAAAGAAAAAAGSEHLPHPLS